MGSDPEGETHLQYLNISECLLSSRHILRALYIVIHVTLAQSCDVDTAPPPVSEEETGTDLSNFPKALQLLSGRSRIQTPTSRLLKHCVCVFSKIYTVGWGVGKLVDLCPPRIAQKSPL